MEHAQLRSRLDALLAEQDRPGAVREIIDAVTSGQITVPELYVGVLGPLMADTGARWQRDEVRVWEEHYLTATVRTAVEALYPHVLSAAEQVPTTGRSVVLACPPREQHDLGLRMLADRFTLAGWTAHYLGTDTPVEEICVAARSLGAEMVLLSASTHFNRVLLRGHVNAVKDCNPDTAVMVGGPAFTLDRNWPADELFDPDAFGLPPGGTAKGGE